MADYRRLWWTLIAVLIVTFSLLGFFGREVYRQAPPIPGKVVTADGKQLMTRDSILDGQTAWQSVGGMQLGSIWGHGPYQAPDWTAWAAATERHPNGATYTNNWPHEPLIGNNPTGENIVWSVVSVVLLVAGIGGLVWGWSFLHKEEPDAPPQDPLTGFTLTPSHIQQICGRWRPSIRGPGARRGESNAV